jgi:microcystin-dependent protein
MNRAITIGATLAALALVTSRVSLRARAVRASVPPPAESLFYAGTLTQGGAPASGAHDLEVVFYAAATGAAPICSSGVQAGTPLVDGRFRVNVSACASALATAADAFVEVVVDGTIHLPPSTTPRPRVAAVPYAAQARAAETAAHVTGTVDASQVVTTTATSVQAQLDALNAIAQSLPGTLLATAAPTCPAGTIAADGSSLARNGTYARLFAAIGTTYGAVDGTHFTLPDARGVFQRGAGSQTIGGLSFTGTQGEARVDTTKRNGLSASSPPHSHVSSNVGNSNVGALGTAGFAGGLGSFTASNLNLGAVTTATSVSVTLSDGDAETSPANITVLDCLWY